MLRRNVFSHIGDRREPVRRPYSHRFLRSRCPCLCRDERANQTCQPVDRQDSTAATAGTRHQGPSTREVTKTSDEASETFEDPCPNSWSRTRSTRRSRPFITNVDWCLRCWPRTSKSGSVLRGPARPRETAVDGSVLPAVRRLRDIQIRSDLRTGRATANDGVGLAPEPVSSKSPPFGLRGWRTPSDDLRPSYVGVFPPSRR